MCFSFDTKKIRNNTEGNFFCIVNICDDAVSEISQLSETQIYNHLLSILDREYIREPGKIYIYC